MSCCATIGLGGLARNWLGDEKTAFWGVIAVPIFHTIGYFFVILLAGLQDISENSTRRLRSMARVL